MSINVTIGNQVIPIPSPGEDPNWASAMDDFCVAVADQLATLSSGFDIAAKVQVLTSDVNTNLNIFDAIFPSGSVRAFVFGYAIYRTNGVISINDSGAIRGQFDTLTSTWFLQHEFVGDRQSDGSQYHTFSMSGDQLQLSTVAIGGSYDSVNSTISYNANTQLVQE